MKIEQKLEQMGIILAAPAAPVANYTATMRQKVSADTSHIYVSGQLPWTGDAKNLVAGILGKDLDKAQGIEAARLAGISTLSALKACIGDLDKVAQVVKLEVFVACVPTFTEHPFVANGCSDLFVKIFGADVGLHARVALGVASLPLGAAVEISSLFAVCD